MAGYRIQGVRCKVKDTWVKLQDKDTVSNCRIQRIQGVNCRIYDAWVKL